MKIHHAWTEKRKQCPRILEPNTITGNDGKSAIIKSCIRYIKSDNQWVLSYSPLLYKTYNEDINVKYCSSVKAIKYICKYVNKGSETAVFVLQSETVISMKSYQIRLGDK